MRLTSAVLAGVVLGVVPGGAAWAQGSAHLTLAPALGAPSLALADDRDDRAITQAFQSVLNRAPTPSELRRYRTLMDENGWTEADVRRDLRDRPDYQRYSAGRGTRPEAVIRRAYQDILGRDPDAEGLRTYRSKMIDQGWTEQDIREALRSSDEYRSVDRRNASADRIIRRAYQDVLGREPDAAGLATYRRDILERGWEEQDVREALRRSPERRGQVVGISDAAATDIVRRAYQAVLQREPDANGMRDYKARVLRDHWTQQQVESALRSSEEYRTKHR